MTVVLASAVAAAVTALSTPALIVLARRIGWVDDPAGAPARKRQTAPVPPVGGAAILLGLCAARWIGGAPLEGWTAVACRPQTALDERWTWTALLAAFAVGLVDDVVPRGLAPRAKLAGQALAGVAFYLACAPCLGGGPVPFVGCVALALIAQNLINTWDNADGAAAGYGALGLAAGAPAAAGACLGFLPWNLASGVARRRAVPRAYLGDSGSHLVGMVLLLTPLAWPVFVPCALDLVRLVWVRNESGDAPWQGDRRHLAHRLQEAGLGPRGVLAVLVLVALPALVPTWVPALRGALGGTLGIGASVALYALLIRWTVEPAVRSTD